MSKDLMALLTMTLFVNPAAVELSVWMGDLGCGHPISSSVVRIGTIFLAVMYSATSSASAADAITGLMISAIVKTATLLLLHLRLRKCVPLPYSSPWFHSGNPRLHVPPVPYRSTWRVCRRLGKLRHSPSVGWLPCLYFPWQLLYGCLWCWDPQADCCLLLLLNIAGVPLFPVIAWFPLCIKACLCILEKLFVDLLHIRWVCAHGERVVATWGLGGNIFDGALIYNRPLWIYMFYCCSPM